MNDVESAPDRKYVILKQETEDPQDKPNGKSTWAYAGVVNAGSPDSAIRYHAEKHKLEKGQYVAIPERSWKPLTVSVRVERRVLVSS